MRKISAWVAIIAVPTMIAGIYGMNFDYMPETGWRYSYFVLLGVMAVRLIRKRLRVPPATSATSPVPALRPCARTALRIWWRPSASPK